MIRLMPVAFAALLSGCMTTAYQAPISDATATIKFANQGRGKGEIFIYQQAEKCTGKQDAGSVERMQHKVVPVRTDAPISFSFGYGFSDYAGGKSCAITAMFEPQASHEYEVLLVSTYQGCAAYLYELVNGHKTPIEGQQKTYSKALTNDSWCE